MAEDLIELGLEGFDRLVDKYHDWAYDTATDGAGTIWRKVHLPGRRNSVYVEQNPDKGQSPEIYDPTKDERPEGFKKDSKGAKKVDNQSAPRESRSSYSDYGYGRGRRNAAREPVSVDEQDYFGNNNLDSSRKAYPNEMPRDTYGEYPPPPPQPGTYFQQVPRAPMNDYGPPPQAGYSNVGQHLAPPTARAALGQNLAPQYHPKDLGLPYGDSSNYLERQRSYDGRLRRDDRDSEFSPPRRRRTRSAPRDRNRDRDYGQDYDRDYRHDYDRDRRKSKDYSLGASLAGVVAGGILGRSLGKGDLVTTVAGGVVGALSGDILADKRSNRDKKDREKYNKDKYNGDGEKDYGRDYVYKDRY